MDPKLQSLIDVARVGAVRVPAGQPVDRAEAARLAEEFEAVFVLQMLRQMRESMGHTAEEEEDTLGFGKDVMLDTIDVELARHLARTGGLGFKQIVLDGLDRELAPGRAIDSVGGPTPSGAAAGPSPAAWRRDPAATVHAAGLPVAGTAPAGEAGDATLVLSRVTSAFGWRADPFHGRTTFHAGVDLKAAYGADVPSVSEGTVAFAGEQGAYGLTVVVDHGGGLTTRYAHLSAVTVQTGDRVDGGMVVGRVGQSGRATAAHLHFEVLHQGRRLDPSRAAEEFQAAGLKLVALDVD
ncbi:MAG: peptidoglycan DD-metalloendopeptidase family protein [Acidobacteriota bacterium]